MARYDARPRGTWTSDVIDDDTDFDLDDLSLLEDPEEYDAPDVRAPRASAPSGRRDAARRERGRNRRGDGQHQGGQAAPGATVADDEELDDLDFADEPLPRQRDRKRVEVSEGFKCRHCRNFIGIPPSGGRNRNHCPLCLYSLHVDDKTPGDRGSNCRSSMQPIGVFYRPKGEQMVVHKCLGCGFVRYNRIAADDNPVVLADLPVLDPPGPGTAWAQGE